MAGAKGRSGGARAGAGPKRKRDTHAKPIKEAEKRCADFLPQALENLKHLANGGYERVTQVWEPAGLVMRKEMWRNDVGEPLLDDKGKPIMIDVPAFPDKDPEELVLVERRLEVADKDRASNVYLADRTMGKPLVKQDITSSDGTAAGVVIYMPDNGREQDTDTAAQEDSDPEPD